jgi:hypothetical protein
MRDGNVLRDRLDELSIELTKLPEGARSPGQGAVEGLRRTLDASKEGLSSEERAEKWAEELDKVIGAVNDIVYRETVGEEVGEREKSDLRDRLGHLNADIHSMLPEEHRSQAQDMVNERLEMLNHYGEEKEIKTSERGPEIMDNLSQKMASGENLRRER